MYKTIRTVLAAITLGFFMIPALSFAATINSTLSIGSSGADVTALQTFLSTDASIYPEGLVTGYYGSLTASAVTRFQARYGIDQVGVVGPVTLAKINALLASGGFGSGGGSTGGSTGDISSPVMSTQAVSVSSNTATIAWNNSEASYSRVMYNTYWPFLYASAPSVSDASQGDTNASVTITGLTPGTRYYFVPESVDASNNLTWTVAQSFVTSN